MNYHTQHLESVLLVTAILFPAGFGANISLVMGRRQDRSLGSGLIGIVIAYFVIAILAALVQPERVLIFNLPPHWLFIVLAPLAGLACIFLEYLVGIGLFYLRTGKLATRMAVHSTYSGPSHISLSDIVLVIAFVIGEELLLRQVLFGLLSIDLALPLGAVIASCTIIYAINHVTFGFQSVIAKLVSGLLYVALFYFSGLSIIVPIIAHVTQNLALLVLARTQVAKQNPKR